MPHVAQSHTTHMKMTCHTYEGVMPQQRRGQSYRNNEGVKSHIWTSHATHMKKAYHNNKGVMPHISKSRATHMKKSCPTYEEVTPHTWRRHITRTKGTCHTYQRIMPHIWRSRAPLMNKSRHTYEGAMPQWSNCHATHTKESHHTYGIDMIFCTHLKSSLNLCINVLWSVTCFFGGEKNNTLFFHSFLFRCRVEIKPTSKHKIPHCRAPPIIF